MFKRNLILCMIFFFLISYIDFGWATENENINIIEGITIEGVDVSKLTTSEATTIINQKAEEILARKIKLYLPNSIIPIETNYKITGVKLDVALAVDKAVTIGNQGNIISRLWQRWDIKRKGKNIRIPFTIDRLRARLVLEELLQSYEVPPKDAKILIEKNNTIKIEPHEIGSKVDFDRCLSDLEALLSLERDCEVVVRYKVVNPKYTENNIKEMNITGLMASYSTQFNPGNVNRTKNIKVASEALQNYIIAPGEQFSFNQIVGPRTKEAGYNEATIIQNNEFTEGLGGGVCQVSSTLYNGALLANLQIDERYNHSLIINYVPKGQDAAVVYGSKDLKFTNNTNGYIVLFSSVYNNNLNIKIYGDHQNKPIVKMRNIVERTIPYKTKVIKDYEVSLGKVDVKKSGKDGVVVRVERQILDRQGKLLKSELISRDVYPPVNALVHIHASTEEEHGLEVVAPTEEILELVKNASSE